MEITIRPTDEFVLIDQAVGARVWEGTTADGTPCRLLVAGLLAPEGVDPAAFDAALVPVAFEVVAAPDPELN